MSNKSTDPLASLEALCMEKGLRLTDPRRYVMEILLKSKAPLSAYDILAKLSKKMDNPKPPTAYRAITFLQEHGFVHRIESLNAYVTCDHGHTHDGNQFLVCDACGTVEEVHLHALEKPIHGLVSQKNFKLSTWSTEVHGTCGKCV